MFMKFLGQRPARLGLVATLYDKYSMSALTEAIQNVYGLDFNGKKGPFQRMNSFMVEWELKVDRIKRVTIISATGDGLNAGDVIFHMPENYYQKYDTFVVEDTRQQFMVMNRPQRLRDNDFLLICKILDDSYESTVVGGADSLAGKTTRFVTNYMPELHEEGFSYYSSRKIFLIAGKSDHDRVKTISSEATDIASSMRSTVERSTTSFNNVGEILRNGINLKFKYEIHSISNNMCDK